MKKHLLITFVTILCIFSALQTKAQTDTTKYDLGRITLKKDFTQAVTIKAADLEKIPFITLSGAINNWLYGVYGSKLTFVTVIDGVLNADINAYSIYEIDEITLVQNSLTQLNGISPSQVLLLVKTKRGRTAKGKSGVTVAGQTNLINLRNTSTDTKSTSSFYQQYYASAYTNTGLTQAGVSADWQHYAVPQIQTVVTKLGTPFILNRIKFNGYVDTKLDNNNALSLNAGYAPQTNNANYTYLVPSSAIYYNLHDKENLLHADVKLNSHVATGLNNKFSAGLQHYTLASTVNANQTNSTGSVYTIHLDSNSRVTSYLVKDDISYSIKSGDWQIEPNLNFTYTHFKDAIATGSRYISNTTYYSSDTAGLSVSQNITLLTPSISFSYANAFLLQGGAQTILNNASVVSLFAATAYKKPKLLPFASLTINLLQLNKQEAGDTRWTVYTSYARSMANMSDYTTSFTDTGTPQLANYTAYGYGINGLIVYSDPQYNPYKVYSQQQAGTTLSLLKNKLNISYNYSIRRDNTLYVIGQPYSGGGYYYAFYHPDNRVDMHRVSVDMNLVHTSNFNWVSGINTTIVKSDIDFVNSGINSAYVFNVNNRIVTGGFVNRFTYKKAFAGADMLYRLNEQAYALGIGTQYHVNSFVLQNVYAGYQFSLKGAKNLEVFANARNVLQNKVSDITDGRKFYGFGFKVGF